MEATLTSQMEDYIEAIGQISQETGVARVKDIAARLSVTNASVVGAVKGLKARNLVRQEPYGYIRLTDEGRQMADVIIHRHTVLTRFLEQILGLEPAVAASDACRIEHAASPVTIDRLVALTDFLERSRDEELDWLARFQPFAEAQRRNETV